jgi:hypothetical protein
MNHSGTRWPQQIIATAPIKAITTVLLLAVRNLMTNLTFFTVVTSLLLWGRCFGLRGFMGHEKRFTPWGWLVSSVGFGPVQGQRPENYQIIAHRFTFPWQIILAQK